MVKIVPYEGFVCPCGAGDVVLRESYKPKTRGKLYYACPRSKPLEDTFGCNFLMERGTSPSTGSLTHPRYSPGVSTPQSYSMGTSKNAECSNCKHLLDKITPLEDTFRCKKFLWKVERVRLLVGSPGASTTPVYSPGSSST
nr:hypothetical protein [Tanacetum cinerariifolium]